MFSFFLVSFASSPCPSRVSFPRPACRPSSVAPCCTCQMAHWAKTAAPPRPTGLAGAPRPFTTSSPPKARRTGGSRTSPSPRTNKRKHAGLSCKAPLKRSSPDLEGDSAHQNAACHVGKEKTMCSVKIWACNFTITARLKYRLLAPTSGSLPVG